MYSCPTTLFAQLAIEHMLVTGAHTPIFADKIGSAYTVITKEDIENRQAILVSDLLRDVPGFAVSRLGGIGSQTQIRVRGGEANHLLVLIDGIEANDVTSGEFDFAHLVTDDVERIEIIRGAQSALYGSDALAGVVNIITHANKPEQSRLVYAEAGEFGVVHGGARISQYTDGYYYKLHTSYVNTTDHNISRQGEEDDDYTNGTVSLSAGGSVTDTMKLALTARHTEANSEYDAFDSVHGVVDADIETDVTQDYWRGQFEYINEQHRKHVGGMTFNQTKNENFVNGMNSMDGTRGEKLKLNYQFDTDGDGGDLYDLSYVLTMAAEYERDVFFKQQMNGVVEKWGLNTRGVIAGYQIELWQRMFLSTSVRYDDNSSFNDVTTYHATAAYKRLDSATKLHASYGKGIKNPTFVERFATFAGFNFVGNAELKPEHNISWDIGIDQGFWSNQINIDLTYFRARLEDEINGFAFVNNTFTAVNIDGVSRRRGVEVTASVNLGENVALSAAYTRLKADDPNGAMEVRRPNTASANLTYTLANQRARFNLNASYTGRQEDISPAGGRVTLSSYSLVNIAVTYDISDNISINGHVENLFDQQYEDVVGYQAIGRRGLVGFKTRF